MIDVQQPRTRRTFFRSFSLRSKILRAGKEGKKKKKEKKIWGPPHFSVAIRGGSYTPSPLPHLSTTHKLLFPSIIVAVPYSIFFSFFNRVTNQSRAPVSFSSFVPCTAVYLTLLPSLSGSSGLSTPSWYGGRASLV